AGSWRGRWAQYNKICELWTHCIARLLHHTIRTSTAAPGGKRPIRLCCGRCLQTSFCRRFIRFSHDDPRDPSHVRCTQSAATNPPGNATWRKIRVGICEQAQLESECALLVA